MSRSMIMCSAALIVSLAAGAAAQSPSQEAAIPNLASADFGWQPASGLDFLPVDGKVAPTRRGSTAPNGERTSDDTNPNLMPWAAEKMRARNAEVRAGHRAFMAQSRCWPGGVPNQLLFIAEPVFFIQTPKEVWIVWERDHHVRRVYLDREHGANPAPSWFGESVGRYENGELVVDTIGLKEHEFSVVDSYATPHTKQLHVVERWKVSADGNTLEAAVTVDDPGSFKAPWSGMVRWRKTDGPIEEWVCAENNLGYEQFFDLPEYPMPVAARPDF